MKKYNECKSRDRLQLCQGSGPESIAEDQRQSVPDQERLIEVYRRAFQVLRADTPDLRKEAYRLRYQVYCVENPFEDPRGNPDEMEMDLFDQRSSHSLLVHRPSGQIAGCVRLVLPPGRMPGDTRRDANKVASAKDLPIGHVCEDPRLADPNVLPPDTTAEVSRFAISKRFRQRARDGRYGQLSEPDPASPITERRAIPHMSLGLISALVQMSVEAGITHWCAVMEPPLIRMLARLGIYFESLGPLVNYHGRRQPLCAKLDTLLAGMWHERPEVWEVITDEGQLWPRPQGRADNLG